MVRATTGLKVMRGFLDLGVILMFTMYAASLPNMQANTHSQSSTIFTMLQISIIELSIWGLTLAVIIYELSVYGLRLDGNLSNLTFTLVVHGFSVAAWWVYTKASNNIGISYPEFDTNMESYVMFKILLLFTIVAHIVRLHGSGAYYWQLFGSSSALKKKASKQ